MRSSIPILIVLSGIILYQTMVFAAESVVVTVETVPNPLNPYGHNIFVQGQQPTIKLVLLTATGRLKSPLLHYSVKDFWGACIDSGTVEPVYMGVGGNVTLTPKVTEVGWYSLEVGIEEAGKNVQIRYVTTRQANLDKEPLVSFAIVPVPLRLGTTPCGVDVGLSWFAKDDNYESLADIASKAGVSWTRDRIRWAQVHQTEEGFTWGKYAKSIDAQQKAGLKVLQTYHDSPQWTRYTPSNDDLNLPDDLMAAYRFAEESAVVFADVVKAWEVWNEQDHIFTHQTADHYAAVLKAASLGYKKGGAQVALGPLAHLPGDYAQLLFMNEIAPYLDAYSFHTYADANSTVYGDVVLEHLAFVQEVGLAGKPVWLSESGLPFIDGDNYSSLRDASLAQIEYLVKSYTTALSLGIERVFWFILPQVLEGGRQWGLLRADQTPLPAYVALANMTALLGKGRYLGEIEVDHSGLTGTVMKVFDSGSGQVLVAWSRVSRVVKVKGSKGSLVVQDPLGGRSEIDIEDDAHYHIKLDNVPRYILEGRWLDAPILETRSTVDQNPPSIVLKNTFPQDSLPQERTCALPGYLIAAVPMTIQVEVYNFGEDRCTGRIRVIPPAGFVLASSECDLSLEPMSKQVIPFRLTPPRVFEHDQYYLQVEGDFEGQSTCAVSRLIVDWNRVGRWLEVDQALQRALLPWRYATSAQGHSVIEQTPAETSSGKAAMTHRFGTSGGCWAFPYLDFPEKVDLSDYAGIRFHLATDAAGDIPATFSFSIRESEGNQYRGGSEYPLDGKVQVFTFYFNHLVQPSWVPQRSYRPIDLTQIDRITFGCVLDSPKGHTQVAYRIEQIELLAKKH